MHKSKNFDKKIRNDDREFDPTPWLKYDKVVLFGYQYFATKLPLGTILVWNKRRDNQLGKFLSDCELAWQKGGKGVYLFNHHWNGFDRASERRQKAVHPSQKPVELFKWIINRLNLPPNSVIFDPYMGSGSCGVAALELGYKFIGCEIEPEYFQIANDRLEKKVNDIREAAA